MNYVPGPASGARVEKQGELWTLIVVRELAHPPALVWEALTDPAQLAQWAPFDADRNLSTPGPAKLPTIGAPSAPADAVVKRADKPKLLELVWGGNELRWELEASGRGTRLTLWHNIDKRFVSWGAAGWHVCLDVLGRMLEGKPVGRTVGPELVRDPDWQRLQRDYDNQFTAS